MPPQAQLRAMPDTPLRFGRCEVDMACRSLRVDGSPVAIERRQFDLLAHLIRQRHRVVSKQELLEKVWPGRRISDSALARAVMKLRQAAGEAVDTSLIRTVPRVGYRFVAALDNEAGQPTPATGPLTLALLPFDNATGDEALDWVGLGLMAMVAEMLAHERRLSLVAMQSLLGVVSAQEGSSPAARAAAVQRGTGAQRVVHGRVSRTATGYRLDFRLFGLADAPVGSVTAARPVELAAELAQALASSLFRQGPGAAPAQAHFLDTMAGEAYARGLQMAAEQRWMPALRLFRMALELEPGHPAVQLELLRALAPTSTDEAEVDALAAELLVHAARDDDACAAARVHQAVGRFHVNRNAFEPAGARLQLALQLADGRESFDWTVQTLLLLSTVSGQQRRFAEAREHNERARELCEHSGNRMLVVGVLIMDACMAAREGQNERLVQLSCDVARQARALRAHRYLCNACGNASVGLAELGRLTEAAAYAEEGFAAALALGDRLSIDEHAASACWVYRLAGAPQASARLLAELEAVQTPVHQEEAIWRARAYHAAGSGDPHEAARCFAAAVQLAREAGYAEQEQQTLPWLIEALILADRRDDAQAEIRHAVQLAAEGNQELQVHVLLLQALLAHRQGQSGEALAFLEQAMQAQPAPLWRAWACADAAWLLAEGGDATAAAAWLAHIDGPPASLPVVLAAHARVLHAAGDTAAAYKMQQRCVAAAPAGNAYFARLEGVYADHAHGTITPAPLPRMPFLSSRL